MKDEEWIDWLNQQTEKQREINRINKQTIKWQIVTLTLQLLSLLIWAYRYFFK